jgi:hypothetical protein
LARDAQLWLIDAFTSLEEALQQVVVEDGDLIAAIDAMQDAAEQQTAKRLLRKRLVKLQRQAA